LASNIDSRLRPPQGEAVFKVQREYGFGLGVR
jgi:hypothetical protein